MLAVFVVVSGTVVSAISLLRHMAGVEVVGNAINGLDISDARLCFLEDSPTVEELIWKNVDLLWQSVVQKERIEELLDERFVRRFVSDKVNDYVEDILKETGNGVIEVRDVEKL